MTAADPHPKLAELSRRWRRRRQAAALGWACGALLPLAVGGVTWAGLTLPVALGLALCGAGLVTLLAGSRQADAGAVARHLDRHEPRLEESCELALMTPEHLAPLARLQRRRTLATLDSLDLAEAMPRSRPTAIWVAALGACLALVLGVAAPQPGGASHLTEAARAIDVGLSERALLRGVEIRIEPPAYTALLDRKVQTLDAEVEEGARVSWSIVTAAEVDVAELVIDGEPHALEPVPDESALGTSEAPGTGGVRWTTSRTVTQALLYRLRLATPEGRVERSLTSRLSVRLDTPPRVTMRAPAPRVQLAAPGRLEVEVEVRDDYAVGPATLVATLAAGSGEMVEFREERFELSRRQVAENGSVVLRRVFDLAALGMAEGTELYLFAEAEDRRTPQPNIGRSVTHVVRIPGARQRTIELGAGLPVVQPPDFFRSQRQIILDTEKLLAERDALTADAFRQRSESLGLDQRALRMRYGGLLGDEFVDGRAATSEDIAAAAREVARRAGKGSAVEDSAAEEEPGHGHGAHHHGAVARDRATNDHADHAHADGPGHAPEESSNGLSGALASLPAGLVHAHDSAESATFFNRGVRATLKAALAQMWDAELHLRSMEPEAALPYEYAALELLKEAQRAERVYVARVGFEAPVLEPEEKRLTGELDDIRNRRIRLAVEPAASYPALRRALLALAAWRRGGEVPSADALEEAAAVLEERAVEDGDVDLVALDRLRDWSDLALHGQLQAVEGAQVTEVEGTLWRLLPAPPAAPVRGATSGGLYESYRAALAESSMARSGQD